MVGVGEGGGARVKVATAVAEGAREALGASVAVAGDAEEEAVGFVAEGGAVAVTEGLPRDTEGDPEGAGVPDARALTLGEELTRSLAVAGDGLGEPVSAEVREGLPDLQNGGRVAAVGNGGRGRGRREALSSFCLKHFVVSREAREYTCEKRYLMSAQLTTKEGPLKSQKIPPRAAPSPHEPVHRGVLVAVGC